jgi:alpha-beta hydrolase superfamily lysophospholipase
MSVGENGCRGLGAVRTSGVWFGDAERLQLGWLTVPTDRSTTSAVVIAPPVGYPYICAYRTLRVVAERLAAQGHTVLRVDYDGTGDSAGDQWDPDRLPAWRATLQAGVDALRAAGMQTITLAGARLGATFALLDGAELGADAVIAWAPVPSGRRLAKELRMMSTAVPDDQAPEPGTLVSGGNVFSAQTLDAIKSLSLDRLDAAPASRVLLVGDPGTNDATAQSLSRLGAEVRCTEIAGGGTALETPPEYGTVPVEVVEAICAFAGDAAASDDAPAGSPTSPGERRPGFAQGRIRHSWRGGVVEEEVLTLEPHGHVAVLTEPAPAPDGETATLVFLNSGSEPHTGPGRCWVEYARDLARLGHRVVRVDWRGWGESPDDGRAPGRPYGDGTIEDTAAIVDSLRARGYTQIALSGLCSSAWIALQALSDSAAAGAIVFNPHLFWEPGLPFIIDAEAAARRYVELFGNLGDGLRPWLWSALDAIGLRPFAGRFLDRIATTGKPVTLIFAEEDLGIRYLRDRLSRRTRQVTRRSQITVQEIPEIDHPMYRAWLRPFIVDALNQALSTFNAASTAPEHTPAGVPLETPTSS